MPTRRQFISSVPGVVSAAHVYASTAVAHVPGAAWLAPHRANVQRLIDASMGSTAAWERLAELCDTFGGRLTGSRNLELACEWAAETMRKDGLENVRLQKTFGPRWTRGTESP